MRRLIIVLVVLCSVSAYTQTTVYKEGVKPAGSSGDLQTNNGSGGLGSVAQSSFIATGAGGYTIPFIALSSGSPAAGSVRYLGASQTLESSPTNAQIIVPRSCTIKSIYVRYSGTCSSCTNEAGTIGIRVNDTTDSPTSAASWGTAAGTQSITNFNVPVTTSDTFVVKITFPSPWATPLNSITYRGFVYCAY